MYTPPKPRDKVDEVIGDSETFETCMRKLMQVSKAEVTELIERDRAVKNMSVSELHALGAFSRKG